MPRAARLAGRRGGRRLDPSAPENRARRLVEAEDRLRVVLDAEGLQVLGLFAKSEEIDRDLQLAIDADQRTAAMVDPAQMLRVTQELAIRDRQPFLLASTALSELAIIRF